MNNPIKRKNLITPESGASFIPIFVSSSIAILLFIFFVIPQYINSNKVNLELNSLIKKKNQLDNLKSQYKIINQKFAKLNNQKSKIIEIISGTSNLDTLLAKVGEIGKKNNIEFVSINPKRVMSFVENSSEDNKNKKDKPANLILDPLLVQGTKKYLIEFSFKTDFMNLLSLMRELEFQENVILLDDMNLKLTAENSNNQNFDNPKGMLDIKLIMTSYGKI